MKNKCQRLPPPPPLCVPPVSPAAPGCVFPGWDEIMATARSTDSLVRVREVHEAFCKLHLQIIFTTMN